MEPNETKVWFYIKDRQQQGPVGFFELNKLFEHGVFGTTIGRSLLNIKIKCVNGQLLDIITSFKRSLFILTFGKGIRFPVINLIYNLRKKTRSIWDVKAGTIVLYGKVSLPRMLLGVCTPLAVFITGIIIS